MSSSDLKLSRAVRHFVEIERDYRELAQRNGHELPYRLLIRSGERGDFGIMAHPSIDWSLMVGDCIQNLRAALDHRIWELSSDDARASRPDSIEFPVFIDSAKYWSAKGKRLGGIEAAAIATIDAAQPFAATDPPTHPLWLLHELSRIDRHRQIHIAYMATRGVLMQRERAEEEVVWTITEDDKPIESSPATGSYASIVLAAMGPGQPKDYAIDAVLDVAFSDPRPAGGLGVVSTLRAMIDTVRDCLDRLRVA